MCTFWIMFIPYSTIIIIIINIIIIFIIIIIIIIEKTTQDCKQIIEKGWLSGLMIGLYNMT